VRGVLDATNSSDRTDDDRERWQRFQRHVFCFFFACVVPNKFFEEQKKKKKKKKKKENVCLSMLLSE